MAITWYVLKWLRYLLRDFRVPQLSPTPIFFHNQVAIHITNNAAFHEGMKYIEIDCHFMCDEFSANHISPAYIPTAA